MHWNAFFPLWLNFTSVLFFFLSIRYFLLSFLLFFVRSSSITHYLHVTVLRFCFLSFNLFFYLSLSRSHCGQIWLTMRSMRLLLLLFCVTQIDCVHLSRAHEVSLVCACTPKEAYKKHSHIDDYPIYTTKSTSFSLSLSTSRHVPSIQSHWLTIFMHEFKVSAIEQDRGKKCVRAREKHGVNRRENMTQAEKNGTLHRKYCYILTRSNTDAHTHYTHSEREREIDGEQHNTHMQ